MSARRLAGLARPPSRKVDQAVLVLAVTRALSWSLLVGALLVGVEPVGAQRVFPTKIEHVIVIVKENHTFDNYFGQFPGADGATTVRINGRVQSPPRAADSTPDIDHSFLGAHLAYNHGQMDRFDQISGARVGTAPLTFAQYREADIPGYWAYARQFVLFDRYFTSVMGPSTPNHLFVVAASAGGATSNARGTGNRPACAVPNASIAVLTAAGTTDRVSACLDLATLPNVLAGAGLSWKGYGFWVMGGLHRIYDDPAMRRSLVPEGDFLRDLQGGAFPAVAWLFGGRDEHPPRSICDGHNWTIEQVNAVMRSPYWKSSLIILTWDDWGGWYDHVPPPQADALGLGFRVPMLVMSPYAKKGYISHQQADHASVPKTIETLFHLPALGPRDQAAHDLLDAVDFTQPPRPPFLQQPRSCP